MIAKESSSLTQTSTMERTVKPNHPTPSDEENIWQLPLGSFEDPAAPSTSTDRLRCSPPTPPVHPPPSYRHEHRHPGYPSQDPSPYYPPTKSHSPQRHHAPGHAHYPPAGAPHPYHAYMQYPQHPGHYPPHHHHASHYAHYPPHGHVHHSHPHHVPPPPHQHHDHTQYLPSKASSAPSSHNKHASQVMDQERNASPIIPTLQWSPSETDHANVKESPPQEQTQHQEDDDARTTFTSGSNRRRSRRELMAPKASPLQLQTEEGDLSTPIKRSRGTDADSVFRRAGSSSAVQLTGGISMTTPAQRSFLSSLVGSFGVDTPGRTPLVGENDDFSPMMQSSVLRHQLATDDFDQLKPSPGPSMQSPPPGEESPFSGLLGDFPSRSYDKKNPKASPLVFERPGSSYSSSSSSARRAGIMSTVTNLRASPMVASTTSQQKNDQDMHDSGYQNRRRSETKPRRLWENQQPQQTPGSSKPTPTVSTLQSPSSGLRIELLGGRPGNQRSLEQVNSRLRGFGASETKREVPNISQRPIDTSPPSTTTGSHVAEGKATIGTSDYMRTNPPSRSTPPSMPSSTPTHPPNSIPPVMHHGHAPYGSHPRPPSQHHALPPPSVHALHTPLKHSQHHAPPHLPIPTTGGSGPHSGGRHPPPPHHHHHGYYPVNTSALISPMPRSANGRTIPVVTGPSIGSGKKPNQGSKRPPCKCKKSRCLKLYCDCFGANAYCHAGCRCLDCHNQPGFEALRTKAMKEIKSKNPNAFKPRLEVPTEVAGAGQHNMGCKCSKTGCLKKYCEVRVFFVLMTSCFAVHAKRLTITLLL